MAGQIRFFEKNKADFSDMNVIVSASQGQTYADRVRDRSNNTAWVTTGSVDADNTTFEIDFGDTKRIDSILLLKHNFKSYEIEYWNGSAWTAFPTPIDETVFAGESSFHQFTAVETTGVKLTIRGTQIVDDEKKLYQFVCTEEIGQFNAWPVIKGAKTSRNRTRQKMLSGKENIREQVGAFSCSLSVAILSDSDDLDIIEALHDANEGFLVWLSGGDEAQFSSPRKGYRLEDLFLMKCVTELTNEFFKGIYPNGLVVKFDLVEVVD